MAMLARAGFAARGIIYVIVGVLAFEVAFGGSGHEADQAGAVRTVAATPVGGVLLWLLAIGFVGMALWRLSEALRGGPAGRKAGTRVAALARAVIYGVIAFVILKYALGLGAPASSNRQAVDLTATAMRHPGGRIAVGIAGLVLIACGAGIAYQAWTRRFLADLNVGQMGPRVRPLVVAFGRIGGIARGTVFAAAGVFLVIAAVTARAHQAKGLDATLRAFTRTPAGPWLLAVVAAGLIVFGVYSLAEARWRRL
jgi:uncharacterized protein DUF1206